MKRIERSRSEKVLAGVCGGFAQYLNIDPIIVRILWIFFTLFGGAGVLAYILAIFIIPEESLKTTTDHDVEQKDESSIFIWGIVLILVGLVLFFQHKPIIHLIWNSFWGAGINILFAILIVGLGIYLVYSRRELKNFKIGKKEIGPLHLSRIDKRIAGVCGGLAEALMVDSTLVRFLWIFATFISAGIGIVLYIILMLILDREKIDNQ
ncbi:PspC domain-containing protein [Candidatus Neomarinimicrobiota bacterium]